jgi:hypothetical protein
MWRCSSTRKGGFETPAIGNRHADAKAHADVFGQVGATLAESGLNSELASAVSYAVSDPCAGVVRERNRIARHALGRHAFALPIGDLAASRRHGASSFEGVRDCLGITKYSYVRKPCAKSVEVVTSRAGSPARTWMSRGLKL